jgi:hypothetical protein
MCAEDIGGLTSIGGKLGGRNRRGDLGAVHTGDWYRNLYNLPATGAPGERGCGE